MTEAGYTKLDVWRKSMDFVVSVYGELKNFPKDELYGLTSQIRRAAVSVPSNIAEGRSRLTTKEFMRYINVACGSLAEVETQIILAQKLGYMNQEGVDLLLGESVQIGRMLNKLYAVLEAKKDIAA